MSQTAVPPKVSSFIPFLRDVKLQFLKWVSTNQPTQENAEDSDESTNNAPSTRTSQKSQPKLGAGTNKVKQETEICSTNKMVGLIVPKSEFERKFLNAISSVLKDDDLMDRILAKPEIQEFVLGLQALKTEDSGSVPALTSVELEKSLLPRLEEIIKIIMPGFPMYFVPSTSTSYNSGSSTIPNSPGSGMPGARARSTVLQLVLPMAIVVVCSSLVASPKLTLVAWDFFRQKLVEIKTV